MKTDSWKNASNLSELLHAIEGISKFFNHSFQYEIEFNAEWASAEGMVMEGREAE